MESLTFDSKMKRLRECYSESSRGVHFNSEMVLACMIHADVVEDSCAVSHMEFPQYLYSLKPHGCFFSAIKNHITVNMWSTFNPHGID